MTLKWDYRVFLEAEGDYIIREVFYDEAGGMIGCTAEAIEPFAKSLAALGEELAAMQRALALPVLTLADIPVIERREPRPKTRGYSTAEVRYCSARLPPTRLGLGAEISEGVR